MKVTSHIDGATNWLDLSTGDIEGAASFYGALFGWDAPEGRPETGGYRQCFIEGDAVAAIGPKMDPSGPTAWLPYIQVEDATKTTERCEALGGTTLFGPQDVMDLGSMAIIADTTGARLGLWQPKSMKGAQRKDEHGSWAWTELLTSDLPAATQFYGDLFGWTASDGPGDPGQYTMMSIGDTMVGGLMPRPEGISASEVPDCWGVYFTVDSLDAAIEVVKGEGGTVVVEPTEIGPGVFAQFVDPQGAMVGLLEPRH
jgi:predicted enzyme related to lactoylglutathione lyase